MLALKFDSEVVCQMAAFMIASEQPKSVRIPDFQSPQIKDTLSC